MINKLNKALSSTLFKESVIYTFFNIINKIIPFLLLPILTSYLGVKGYGLYSVFIALTLFFRHFAGLNLQSVIHRRFFDQPALDFRVYLFNGLVLITVSSIFTFLAAFMFSKLIESVTGLEASLIIWVILVSMFSNIINVLLNVCRAENRPFMYGFVVVFQSLTILSVTIILLKYSQLNWLSSVAGQVLGCMIVSVYAIIYLSKNGYIKLKLNCDYMKDALYYVIPLIPHGLSGVTFNLSGRLFVSAIEGAEETGYFTIAYQLASLISLVCTAFSTAWTNWLFGKLKAGQDHKEKIVKATYIYFILVSLFGISYSLVLPFFASLILGETSLSHIHYANWIIAGFVFQGFYQVIVGYLFFDNKTVTISRNTMFAACVSLATNYSLISMYGGKGAAISFFISWLVIFLITYMTVRKNATSPW